jgi:hypothetical protein
VSCFAAQHKFDRKIEVVQWRNTEQYGDCYVSDPGTSITRIAFNTRIACTPVIGAAAY